MGKKRLYEEGDLVSILTGQIGMVISGETVASVRDRFREGKKPGYYFAQGCCQNPDYITQVPVFFEDGTYDVMRAMNIRKRRDLPEEKSEEIRKIIETGDSI